MQNRSKLSVSLLWVALIAVSFPSFPAVVDAEEKDQWELLGTRVVDFGADKDTIELDAKRGPFKQICLGVFEAPLEMLDMKVHFANGETADIEVRAFIKAGERTRIIDLPGALRNIAKIDLKYQTKGRRDGKAVVKVFGRHIEPSVNPSSEDKYKGWVKLGNRRVNYGADFDVIDLDAKQGPFKQLWMRVTDADLEMRDMKVHFANGEVAEIQIRAVIKAGEHTRVIDLPGDARFITKITLWYDTKGVKDGKAEVHVWGKSIEVEWVGLGKRVVAVRGEKDEIELDGAKGPFTAFRFQVTESNVFIAKLVIHFMNGETQEFDVKAKFNDGDFSRVIDLPGNNRNIKKVAIWYKAERGEGRALIQFFGRK